MKFVVKHEIKGRIRVHFCQKRMTFEEADTLQYYLNSRDDYFFQGSGTYTGCDHLLYR